MTKHGSISNDKPGFQTEALGAEEMPAREFGFDLEQIENLIPKILKDRDGIPVLYDVRADEKRLDKPDELSALSHELLAPLTLIKGYTATLLQLNHAINEEQKDRYLRGIESAANKLIRLLENIRDLVRLEDNDSANYHPALLSHVIQKIVSEMQSQVTTHLIKFRRFSSLPKINIDQQKIEQVISNLLSNAIKYSPEGSDIEVEIDQFRCPDEMEKLLGYAPDIRFPCSIVSISDSGIGIPEAELKRIFNRFYRLDNRITRTTKGFGFGLYMCKVIVESHGGHIWARNRTQGGSTFSFSLPLQQ